jgi:hypothetical protein
LLALHRGEECQAREGGGRTRGGRRYKFVRNDRNEIVKDADGKPLYRDKMANGSEPSRIAARRVLREGAMHFPGVDIIEIPDGSASAVRS